MLENIQQRYAISNGNFIQAEIKISETRSTYSKVLTGKVREYLNSLSYPSKKQKKYLIFKNNITL